MRRSFVSRLALAAICAGAGLTPAVVHGAAPAGSQQSPAALAALLTHIHPPERDALALYARLVGHKGSPAAPLMLPATDFPIGQQRNFYIGDETNNTYSLHSAHLRLKTPHAYWYVEDGVQMDLAGLRQAAQVWEQHIYPTDVSAFGPERDPALDHDPRVVIFNGATPGAGGYVSSQDLLPRQVFRYSNQAKIIYIANGVNEPNSFLYLQTLAHEFQHLIHKHLHFEDEIWINEGASMLAQQLNGYGVGGDDQARASSGPLQLNVWSSSVGSTPMYGGAYLWLLYLYEHFGGDRFSRTLLADSGLTGLPLIDDVLAKLGSHADSTTVFGDWVVANYLNDLRVDGGRYGYHASAARASLTGQHAVPGTVSASMPQYAASYIDLTNRGGGPITLRFNGAPTVPLLSTVTPTPQVWWSNRADNMDTTLTSPPIDLRGLRHATLRYEAWYDTELNYDYAYVEASADGGVTWYSLPTAHTTTANPEGANLGNGYTGSSCTAAGHDRQCWLTEQADLSQFAGKRILLRWEAVTDEGYNAQGLALANVTVPEAGLNLDTAAPGWQPAGWVQVANSLAERWLVTALVYRADGIQVVPATVGANGRGSLRIPAGASHVVVCVSPVAPETTVPNTFTISAGN